MAESTALDDFQKAFIKHMVDMIFTPPELPYWTYLTKGTGPIAGAVERQRLATSLWWSDCRLT